MHLRHATLGILLASMGIAAPARALTVNTSSRDAVRNFYQTVYLASAGVSSGWTGNPLSCTAGTLSSAYLDAATLRLNYFRALTGLTTDLAWDAAKSQGCQECAEIVSKNAMVNYFPPPSELCYTTLGAGYSSNSLLALGPASLAEAVDLFVQDSHVSTAGHRRWLLYKDYAAPGFGASFASLPGYCIYAFSIGLSGPVPEWTAWPPAGFIPYMHISDMWSFTYAGAAFGAAQATVTYHGSLVPVTVQPVQTGFGDETLVWSVSGFPLSGPPALEEAYHVTVSNVVVNSVPRSFSYDIIPMDPNVVSAAGSPSGEADLALAPPVPSPSHGRASISYRLPAGGAVDLVVSDLSGRRIATVSSGAQVAGDHTVEWNGLTSRGAAAPAGLYFVQLDAAGRRISQRLVVIR